MLHCFINSSNWRYFKEKDHTYVMKNRPPQPLILDPIRINNDNLTCAFRMAHITKKYFQPYFTPYAILNIM